MKVLPRFPPTSFAIPFGLAGLASVWRQMADFYGTPGAVSDVLFIAAAVCWSLLAVAAAVRMVREPRAILGELRDPVLSPFWSLPWVVGMDSPSVWNPTRTARRKPRLSCSSWPRSCSAG